MTPTVFFSHAAEDAPALARLKELFEAHTDGAVQVFLSSDGESIPFGRNWVKRMEEALQQAGMMVVFVTPASVHSKWIYFEAGHAYAQGLRVVPVGFMGVDLADVPPPLGLLQGFNIESEDGLDNLLALTNEAFGHTHPLAFTEDDYQELVTVAGGIQSGLLSGPSSVLGYFSVEVGADHLAMPPDEALATIGDDLKSRGLDYIAESGLTLMGMRVDVRQDREVMFYVEPIALHRYAPLVESLCNLIRQEPVGVSDLGLELGLKTSVRSDHGSRGRLLDSGITQVDRYWLAYESVEFRANRTGQLQPNESQVILARTTARRVPMAEFEALLGLLFERGWLYLVSET